MTRLSKRLLALLTLGIFLSMRLAAAAQSGPAQNASGPDLSFPTVLYGAAYYNEYMPQDTPTAQDERLAKDVALMKAAGLNVVRMGESTWSLWEPEDGHFEYAWMDRVVDAMGKAGIKVILGTPTYSIPAWMAHQHPEILADRIPSGAFGGKAQPGVYGMRQNMDTDSPAYASMPSGSSATSSRTTRTTQPSSAGKSTTKPAATMPPIPMSSLASSITIREKIRHARGAEQGMVP